MNPCKVVPIVFLLVALYFGGLIVVKYVSKPVVEVLDKAGR